MKILEPRVLVAAAMLFCAAAQAEPSLFITASGDGAPLPSWSVTAATPATQQLDYAQFMREVMDANLDYAAQRYNVDIAKAQLQASRLLPNPTLSLAGDRDLTFHNAYGTGTDGQPALLRQVEARSIGLTQTLPLGGKRGWRIRVADQTYRAAAASVDDFLHGLKVDAAEAFAEALATQRTVEDQRTAAGYLAELTRVQEIRFHSGGISEVDLTQTRLEEFQFRNELLKAEDAAAQARLALATFLGRDRAQTDFVVVGKLEQSPQSYQLADLVDRALHERPDLVALRHTRDATQSGVELAKSKIIPDVDVGLTYGYNGRVVDNHPVDPTPAFHQLGLNVSIPLPFFDHGQYDVSAAYAQAEQAQVQLESAELKAQVAIRTAYEQYRSALDRTNAFKGDLLKSADDVLQARRYSYERGGSTLLELLAAQRSAIDVQQAYQDSLADVAQALLELQRVSNVGDVMF